MGYNPKTIRKHFDELAEEEWERLVKSPVEEIKLHIHSHYLKKFVLPENRVLEIGAGPGRFTEILHELQCKVVVADISKVQLNLNKKFATDREFAASVESWIQLDICDMKQLAAESFDVVLVYGGPLSYVLEERDLALQECKRILKRGGLLLASVMSLWGASHRYFSIILELPLERNREIIRTGDLTPITQPENNHHCHMFRAKEYRDFLERNGLEILAMSASNSISTNFETELEAARRDEDLWQDVLKFELEASAEEGYLDGGTHIISVARKPA